MGKMVEVIWELVLILTLCGTAWILRMGSKKKEKADGASDEQK